LLKSNAARGAVTTSIELQRLWSVNVADDIPKRRCPRTVILDVVQRTK
jgi:hypothetical protein